MSAPESQLPAQAPSGSPAASVPLKAQKAKQGAPPPLNPNQSPLELSPSPDYLASRIAIFEEHKAKYDEWTKAQPREPITITLKDGTVHEGTSWETTPMSIAKGLGKTISENVVIAKVDDTLWDTGRPLEKSCKLQLLNFEDPEGEQVFWHSSAHILGEACEHHYGCHLCFGPPTDQGFFYEMAIHDHSSSNSELPSSDISGTPLKPVLPTDYPHLETLAKRVIKEKQKFERLVLPKEVLLEMFKYNKYKVHFIKEKVPEGTSTTVYRCGDMIDLCIGPHIPHTGKIKAFSVLKSSSSYFLGDQKNDSLQRIYGISFPETKMLAEYKTLMEEAAKRDHRKIGREQELYFFNDLSPGSAFFLPHGMRIYNTLQEFIREEYRKRGYQEVLSPNMFNAKLWETSGHWANYKDDMFVLDVEKEKWALKPMNCPGHCVIFSMRDRSYKELPIRMAEFGVLHRNEASGALSGLTRVRRFAQDDTHVFCMPSQIEEEMAAIFDFLDRVYGIFGFTFQLQLSTRPENFLGAIETWDHAEQQLTNVLNQFMPDKWTLNPGDGAFYGPKIDITIKDAFRRAFQCATIQLDFQLPERFNLSYRGPEGHEDPNKPPSRPVMIHRAILGSLERFIAIITEHFGGKWPFWLSPRQVLIIPVAAPFKEYAAEVQRKLWDAGIFVDVDNTDNTLPKKIRTGELAYYNFILVVGQEEQDGRGVNVRNREDVGTKGKNKQMPLDEVSQKLVALKTSRSLQNQFV